MNTILEILQDFYNRYLNSFQDLKTFANSNGLTPEEAKQLIKIAEKYKQK